MTSSGQKTAEGMRMVIERAGVTTLQAIIELRLQPTSSIARGHFTVMLLLHFSLKQLQNLMPYSYTTYKF